MVKLPLCADDIILYIWKRQKNQWKYTKNNTSKIAGIKLEINILHTNSNLLERIKIDLISVEK